MTLRELLSRVTSSARLTFVVAWVALTLTSAAWALTTPLSASPDEPSHIIRASSVVRGEIIGENTKDPALKRVHVPAGIAQAWKWTCYAYQPTVSAACVPPTINGLDLKSAPTSAGLYNPIYYAIVGLPSLFFENTRIDVFAMRALSGMLSSFFLAFTFTMLLRIMSPLLAGVAFFAALTPMVLFLNGSVNPNSIEIASGEALTVGLLAVALGLAKQNHGAILAVTAAAGVLLANSRGLSPLWMALIGVSVLIFAPFSEMRRLFRERSVIIALAVMAAGVAFAALWIALTGTLSTMGTFAGAGQTSPIRAFFVMLVDQTADPGIVGYFGWLDTPAPNLVFFIWSSLLGSLMILSVAFARGRARLALLFSLATVLLVPPVVQASSVAKSGYIWQGRYSLVAVVAAVIFAAVALGSSSHGIVLRRGIASRLVIVVGTLVVIGQLDSLVGALRRYAAPGSPSVFTFLTAPAWAPPGGAVPWLFLALVSLSTVILLWWSKVEQDEVYAVDQSVAPPGTGAPQLA
jgi:hypothetical protein